MLEKIRGVQNPLTIIALFAGIAEIAGTVALAAVDRGLQPVFIWFVMGFPALLVLLFFATLNFNPKVLYAPSDFRTDDNFLRLIRGGQAVADSYRSLTEQLAATEESVDKAVREIGRAGESERARLAAAVGGQIELVRRTAESTVEALIKSTRSIATRPQPQASGRLESIFPVASNLSMQNLAATLTTEEQLAFKQLTGLAADSAMARNLATFINQGDQLGRLLIVARGESARGEKVLSTNAYISGTKTDIDVYRLPLT